jgi:putative FmdB family regulatory protein
MPIYQYQCKKCAEKFEGFESIKEHGTSKPACPKCGSKKVDQVLGTFFAITSKKS